MPTQISFIRHGHVNNPQNIIYGRLPGFSLSDAGRLQAQRAAEALRDVSLSALFTSPRERAVQTAQIILAAHPSLTCQTSALIDEIHIYLEGHPAAEGAALNWDMYTGMPAGYEQPEDIAARAERFITEMRRDYAGQHVAAVSHGDVIAFALLRVLGEPQRPNLKHTLDRFGVTDDYPAPGSIVTLTYHTAAPDEIPELHYLRPYGDELLLPSLS